jgi:uncharacterized damage-inducible protein DinB
VTALLLLDERASARAVPPAVDALQAHLRSLREVLDALPECIYRATPSRTSGSTGEHVRHCLDHARALLSSGSDRVISYDARLRGTRIETDPSVAAAEIDRLCGELEKLDDDLLRRPICLDTLTHRDAPATRVVTTLGREIAFVIQHTIYHCALIAILLEHLGVAVPTRFGYAPSTPSAA